MRHRKLPRNVWDTEIHILYGKRDELNAFFRRRCGATEDRVGERTCGNMLVWEPDNPRFYTRRYISIVTDATTGMRERRHTLLHEAVHCAISILDDKGVRSSSDNDEPLAYLVEWIFRESERVLVA